ncbi:MAG: serine hydrolase domain-containing protein [Gemmatimonadales bacterium]
MTRRVSLGRQHGRLAYETAAGWADRESNQAMRPETIFRIASQTKALTSVAVMQLVEAGKLTLNDRVSRYLPSFERTTVATVTDTGVAILPAKRAITIKDLLTHTAGISYGTERQVAEAYRAKGLGPAAGFGWYTADKDEPICETMERLGTLPFVHQPGEAWVYGYNTDILGCVVERASGMPLDVYFERHITGPLGMRDTHFFLPPPDRERLAAVYSVGSNGKLARAAEGARGQGHYVEGPRRSFAGGAGLLSTARDYGRLLEALANGGSLDGAQILSPRSVELMISNQSGTLFPGEGSGFGLGFQVTERMGAGGGFSSPGSFAWGGAYHSSYLVDPALDLIILVMTQHLPAPGLDLTNRIQTMVYGALEVRP